MEREGRYMPEPGVEIPPEDRAVLEKYLGPLPADAVLNRGAADEESEDVRRDTSRFGLPRKAPRGYKYEWIHSQQLGEVPVKWRKERQEAEKDIKTLLGRIEIAKSSITEQMQVDVAQAKSVLEVLEVREKDKDESGNALSPQQIKEQQDWAKKMRLEIRVRIDFHQAFFAYENKGSVKDVCEAVSSIPSAWMDVIFELKEKIPSGEIREGRDTFNPFIEAMQYYEDHGHEFARHNIATGRVEFGKKVMEDLEKRFGGNAKDYEWAQNMAERMFRTTGRAIMYDYLVINKGKANERMVDINYKPQGSEKIEWAGGRDGCDYPMSKILRFRENLATSSEGNMMRPHLELMDGVDIFGGDFWSRTVRGSNVKNGSGALWTYRVKREDFVGKVEAKTRDLMEKDGKTREEAEEIARKLYFAIDKPDPADQRANEYYEADIYTDREHADNEGEMVGRINFRQMERIKGEDGKLKSGIEFEENSGDSPWGIWIVRRLGGAEEAKKGLTENASSFLLNPNFESLSKLMSTFDATKENHWAVKEQLLKNFIKFARSKDIEGTGRPRLSEDEILAGVNKLTGLTDPNAPQFVQMSERMGILSEYFNIKIPDSEIEKIREQAMGQAIKELDQEVAKGLKTREAANKEIAGRAELISNRMINGKLNGKIEGRVNRKFAGSFAGNFILGTFKEVLKQAFPDLSK